MVDAKVIQLYNTEFYIEKKKNQSKLLLAIKK